MEEQLKALIEKYEAIREKKRERLRLLPLNMINKENQLRGRIDQLTETIKDLKSLLK